MDTNLTIALHILGYLSWRHQAGREEIDRDEFSILLQMDCLEVRYVFQMLEQNRLIHRIGLLSARYRLGAQSIATPLQSIYQIVATSRPTTRLYESLVREDRCSMGRGMVHVMREINSYLVLGSGLYPVSLIIAALNSSLYPYFVNIKPTSPLSVEFHAKTNK